MNDTTFDPANTEQWRVWAADLELLREHELVFDNSDVDAHGNILLLFTSPYQDSAALVEISMQLPDLLPATLRDRLVMVDRMQSDPAGRDGPPRISIGLMVNDVTDGSTGRARWTSWVNVNPVLREFDLKLASVTEEPDEIVLTMTCDAAIDLEDLQSQAPRLKARLDIASMPAPRLHFSQPAPGQVLLQITRDLFARTPDLTGLISLEVAEMFTDEPAPAPPRRRWRFLLDQRLVTSYRWLRPGRPVPAGYPGTVHAGIAVAGAALAVICVVTVFALLVAGFLLTVAKALAGGAGFVHDSQAARTVLGPVRSWIDAYAGGYGYSGNALMWLWGATGIATFLLGWLSRNIGARIGWTLFGAATAYMAYHGTSIPSRPVVAGIVAVWWILGSLLVFRRRGGTQHVIAQVPGLAVNQKDGTVRSWGVMRKLGETGKAVRDLVAVMPDEPEEGPVQVTTDDLPRSARRGRTSRIAIDSTSAVHWEELLRDAGVPARMVYGDQRPICDDDGLATGRGFVVHFSIMQDPDSAMVCTVDTVLAYRGQIAVLIAQRFPHLFSGPVTRGAVQIEATRNSYGAPLVDEIDLTVWTATVYDPTSDTARNIAHKILDPIRVYDGLTEQQITDRLRAAGVREISITLTRRVLSDMLGQGGWGLARLAGERWRRVF